MMPGRPVSGARSRTGVALVSQARSCAATDAAAHRWRIHAMPFAARFSRHGLPALLTLAVTVALSFGTFAQQPSAGQAPTTPPATAPPPAQAAPPPNPNAAATAADHKNMMEQLGITTLRPGPSGNESAPNHANYDEAIANPYPLLPDPLKLENGKKVKTAKVWWTQRRPEIVEDFDREVLGRVPKNVPKVAWRVNRTEPF